jgi:hypothetical protein
LKALNCKNKIGEGETLHRLQKIFKRYYIMKKWFLFIKSLFDGSALRDAIESGAVDFSGQGRDKYGK